MPVTVILAAQSVFQSPLVVTLIGVGVTALLSLALAAIKMVVQLSNMQMAIAEMQKDVTELKTDPDIMRWSNYGRAVHAFGSIPPQQGAQP